MKTNRSESRSAGTPLRPVLALLVLALAGPACAQDEARPARPDAAAGEVGRDSMVALAEASRSKGAPSAPVTIIEVSDFQCPYCREFAVETFPKLDSAYIQTGRVRLIFYNYPLPNHPEAWPASEAALCAGAQGRFWPMHDRLFQTQQSWSGSETAARHFETLAGELKLDLPAFRQCVADDRMAPLLVNDVMLASSSGITGTPTFIFNGQEAVGGALPFEEFQRRIDALLAAGPQTGGSTEQPVPPAQP